MNATNAVLLIAAAGLVLIAVKWAFLPDRRLPRHRVRHLRIRLRLRLHPGKGHATLAELWWRWGRLAAVRHGRRTRPGLTFAGRVLAPASEQSVLVGRAHYRHALRLPLDEHAAIFSPPRGGKTGWLARVILRYPARSCRPRPSTTSARSPPRSAPREARCTCSTPSASAMSSPPSGGTPWTGARTRR